MTIRPLSLAVGVAFALSVASSALHAQICTPPPPGMVSWWPGDGDSLDIQDGHHGSNQGVAHTAALVGEGFDFTAGSNYVHIDNAPDLDFSQGQDYSLDFWMKAGPLPATGSMSLVEKWRNVPGPYPYVARLDTGQHGPRGTVVCAAYDGATNPGATTVRRVDDGAWHHVACVFRHSQKRIEIYLDGQFEASGGYASLGNIQNGLPIFLGTRGPGAGGVFDPAFEYNGALDEIEIFSRALSASEIQAIHAAGSAGKCKPTCTPAPAGMVSWWPGDGSSRDIQQGADGALQAGAGFVSGRVRNAFRFDGVDDYVRVNHRSNLDPAGSFSIEAWVRTSTASGGRTIVSKYECGQTCISSVSNSAYILAINSGLPSLFVRDTDVGGPASESEGQNLTGTAFIADGNWHHVAVTRDLGSGTLNLYVDGALDASEPLNAGATGLLRDDDGEPDPLTIGAQVVAGSSSLERFFAGEIDEPTAYSTALSAAEIQSIYAAGSAGKCRSLCGHPDIGAGNWWTGDGHALDVADSAHGTLNGTTFSSGMSGQAFRFDGVDDYVRVSHRSNLDPAGSFSIEAWVRTSTASGGRTIVSKYECGQTCISSVSNSAYILAINSGLPSLFVRDTDVGGPASESEGQNLTGTAFIADGNWHHVAVTRDLGSGTLNLYVDGALDASEPLNAGATGLLRDDDGEPDPLTIGAQVVAGSSSLERFFAGEIDELTITPRALSAGEIQAIFNGGAGIAPEVCDGLDNDCDTATDEGLGSTTCGVGECVHTVQNCVGGVGQTCAPGSPTPEICDGLDNDCDGAADEAVAASCYTGPAGTEGIGECRPGASACAAGSFGPCAGDVTPQAELCDALDNDCDGAADEDLGSTSCGVGECARTVQNCVGGVSQTCAPGTPGVEICDALDNDCDGSTDESLVQACYTGPAGTANVGECREGVSACSGGAFGACSGDVTPAAESCDGLDSDCDGVTDEGAIEVTAERRTTGPGAHPSTATQPLAGIIVRVFDRSDGSCIRAACGGVGAQQFGCIVGSGCPAAAQGTTSPSGTVRLEVPPDDYLVIGEDEFGRLFGSQAPDLLCGEATSETIRQIVTQNGKTHPARASVRSGSLLLVIEPEYVEWTGEQELYPFIFESLGDWSVSTSVAPPEGFVSDHEVLTAEVTSDTQAVQFTITDVGSDWVPTEVRHVITHGARKEVLRSRVGVRLGPDLARRKGVDAAGRVLDAPGPSASVGGHDPRAARPAEILGWIEPTAADPDWTVKVRVNAASDVKVSIVGERGEIVRVLAGGRLQPGEYAISWDGRDRSGRSLIPGTYDLSVQTRAASDVVRLIAGEEN